MTAAARAEQYAFLREAVAARVVPRAPAALRGAYSITEGEGRRWRFGARVVVLVVCVLGVQSRVFRNTLWSRGVGRRSLPAL